MVDENNHDNYLIPNVEDIPFDFDSKIIYKEKFRSNLDRYFKYLMKYFIDKKKFTLRDLTKIETNLCFLFFTWNNYFFTILNTIANKASNIFVQFSPLSQMPSTNIKTITKN